MKPLRIALLVIGIACIGPVAFTRYSNSTGQVGEVLQAQMSIGLPCSPWYHRVERDGGVTTNIHPLSWSTLSALTSLGCFSAFVWLRPPRPARQV